MGYFMILILENGIIYAGVINKMSVKKKEGGANFL
jgi:hypothetical protein